MATKDVNYLLDIHGKLEMKLDQQADALPLNFNKERFVQNCMTVLKDGNADFSKCAPDSVARTLIKGAFLGLDFFNGECYAIPYGDKCQFQTDYKGEIKLAKQYSSNPIKDIYAKLVREGDFFEEIIENGQQLINFKPKPFNDGEILGAFAVCLYKDGSMIYDTMSKAEIEHTRMTFSKMSNSKAWKDATGEMYKKTVLRRLCKLIDLNFNSPEAKSAFEDGSDFDVRGNRQSKEKEAAVDVFADKNEVVVEAVDVTEQKQESEGKNE